jgi:hypothetical protein
MKEVRFFTNRGIRTMTMVMRPTYTTMVNGFPAVTQGKRLEFKEGEFITSDKDEVDYLRNHKNYNSTFFEDITETAKSKVKV